MSGERERANRLSESLCGLRKAPQKLRVVLLLYALVGHLKDPVCGFDKKLRFAIFGMKAVSHVFREFYSE